MRRIERVKSPSALNGAAALVSILPAWQGTRQVYAERWRQLAGDPIEAIPLDTRKPISGRYQQTEQGGLFAASQPVREPR